MTADLEAVRASETPGIPTCPPRLGTKGMQNWAPGLGGRLSGLCSFCFLRNRSFLGFSFSDQSCIFLW